MHAQSCLSKMQIAAGKHVRCTNICLFLCEHTGCVEYMMAQFSSTCTFHHNRQRSDHTAFCIYSDWSVIVHTSSLLLRSLKMCAEADLGTSMVTNVLQIRLYEHEKLGHLILSALCPFIAASCSMSSGLCCMTWNSSSAHFLIPMRESFTSARRLCCLLVA